jgi:hypothetical protein
MAANRATPSRVKPFARHYTSTAAKPTLDALSPGVHGNDAIVICPFTIAPERPNFAFGVVTRYISLGTL